MILASVVEFRGRFIAVARGGRGLLVATFPCKSSEEAKKRILDVVFEVNKWGDKLCEEVAEKMFRFLEGEKVDFNYEVDLSHLTPFQKAVLEEVRRIPLGTVLTYGELARRIGKPKAARAVGNVLKKNPLPLIIPCHRVIGARGLGGYAGGLEIKIKLLENEGARR